MLVRRSVKISLKWVGVRDRRRLCALVEAYRAAVNFYIRLLWSDPTATFSTATSKRLVRTRLSARYRDQALKQAVEIVSSTRKSVTPPGVTPTRPFFKGSAVLDAKFVRVELGSGEFNLSVRVSSLQKRKRVVIRSKRTGVLQKWLAMPGARLVEGCALGGGDLLTLWVEFPAPAIRREGPVLGVDVGVTRLLATSDGVLLGTEFRAVRDKVRRRKPGSKGRRRARRERDDLVCAATKRLPWDGIRAVAFEDLTGIKHGKRRGRYRSFRRAIAPWRPSFAATRMTCLAVEHGVLAIPVPARGNSTSSRSVNTGAARTGAGPSFAAVGVVTRPTLTYWVRSRRSGAARPASTSASRPGSGSALWIRTGVSAASKRRSAAVRPWQRSGGVGAKLQDLLRSPRRCRGPSAPPRQRRPATERSCRRLMPRAGMPRPGTRPAAALPTRTPRQETRTNAGRLQGGAVKNHSSGLRHDLRANCQVLRGSWRRTRAHEHRCWESNRTLRADQTSRRSSGQSPKP